MMEINNINTYTYAKNLQKYTQKAQETQASSKNEDNGPLSLLYQRLKELYAQLQKLTAQLEQSSNEEQKMQILEQLQQLNGQISEILSKIFKIFEEQMKGS